MYLRDLGATLLRRWYLSITGLIGTAALCFVAMNLFPATYEAKATIVLLPPASTVEAGGNPYLQLANLQQAVDVMVRSLSSQSAVDQVEASAPTGDFEVAPDYTTSGPIFIVTAADKTPEATLATLKTVSDMVPPTLIRLQDDLGIASNSQITSDVLTMDVRPETVRKTQFRVLIVAAAIGLLASAMIIALFDSYLNRRKQRRNDDPGSRRPDSPKPHSEETRPLSQPGVRGAPARPRRMGLRQNGSAILTPEVEAGSSGMRR